MGMRPIARGSGARLSKMTLFRAHAFLGPEGSLELKL